MAPTVTSYTFPQHPCAQSLLQAQFKLHRATPVTRHLQFTHHHATQKHLTQILATEYNTNHASHTFYTIYGG